MYEHIFIYMYPYRTYRRFFIAACEPALKRLPFTLPAVGNLSIINGKGNV